MFRIAGTNRFPRALLKIPDWHRRSDRRLSWLIQLPPLCSPACTRLRALGQGSVLLGSVCGGRLVKALSIEDRSPRENVCSAAFRGHGGGAGCGQGEGFGHPRVHTLGARGGCFDQQGPSTSIEVEEPGLVGGAGLNCVIARGPGRGSRKGSSIMAGLLARAPRRSQLQPHPVGHLARHIQFS